MEPPEAVEAWYARVDAALGGDRTLAAAPPDGAARWEAFPFVVADDARTRPLLPLSATDRGRAGEEPAQCHCADASGAQDTDTISETDLLSPRNLVWCNDNWQLRRFPRTGLPIVALLEPIAHHDLPDLPGPLAAELGLLTVHLASAVESLPSVGRCHVCRWGDGGAHGHLWFLGRPLRHHQVIGSFAVLWDGLLPALPDEVRDANAAHVVRELIARAGGTPLGAATPG